MAIDDVRDKWTTYRLLPQVMWANINGKVEINSPRSPVEDFPETKPSRWGEWLQALAFFVGLHEAFAITDAAFAQAAAFMTAANRVAAAVNLEAPKRDEVNDLIAQLNVVNEAIRQDGRFRAALAIGSALADEIEGQLKKKKS